MLVKVNSQNGFWFGRKTSYLNNFKPAVWVNPIFTSFLINLITFNFIILFYNRFLLNLCFNSLICPVLMLKLAFNLLYERFVLYGKNKLSFCSNIFNVDIMLDHLKWAHWIHDITRDIDLFERYGVVGARHHKIECVIPKSLAQL